MKIRLNQEQSNKFFSYLIDDLKRIVREDQRAKKQGYTKKDTE